MPRKERQDNREEQGKKAKQARKSINGKRKGEKKIKYCCASKKTRECQGRRPLYLGLVQKESKVGRRKSSRGDHPNAHRSGPQLKARKGGKIGLKILLRA